MIDIKLEVQSGQLDKMFIRLSDSFKDLRIPLKRTGVYMISSVDRNFRVEGRPRKWQALAPMTLAMRRAKGATSAKILQDTGHLRRSITYQLEGKTGLKVGTNVKYGRLHQFGGRFMTSARTEVVKSHFRTVGGKKTKVKKFERDVKKRTTKVPARPFLLIQDVDVTAIEKIFNSWMGGVIGDNIGRDE